MLHSLLVTLEFSIIPVMVPLLLLINKTKKRSRTPISHLYDEFAFELLATDSTLIIAFYVRVYGDSDRYLGAMHLMTGTLLLAIVYILCSIVRALSAQSQKTPVNTQVKHGAGGIAIWNSSFLAKVVVAHGVFALYLIFVTIFLYKH